jgi:hypothetical protein
MPARMAQVMDQASIFKARKNKLMLNVLTRQGKTKPIFLKMGFAGAFASNKFELNVSPRRNKFELNVSPRRNKHQFCAGVFSLKYSWLSALSKALVTFEVASDFAAD